MVRTEAPTVNPNGVRSRVLGAGRNRMLRSEPSAGRRGRNGA